MKIINLILLNIIMSSSCSSDTIGKESKIINNSWKEFYRDSITGNYCVDRAKYTVSTYTDECLGMECEYIKSGRQRLF